MSKHRPRTRRRKNQRKRNLTPIQRNEVLVLREMGMTYPAICTKTQLSYGTVTDVCRKSQSDPAELQKIRGEALLRAAKDTFTKGLAARDAITPEDLVQERINVRDNDGNLVDIRLRGPSPLQNATTFGIFMDQASKMQTRGDVLMTGGKPPLDPEHLLNLMGSLAGRISALRIEVDVDGLGERLDGLVQGITNAEFTEVGAEGEEDPQE